MKRLPLCLLVLLTILSLAAAPGRADPPGAAQRADLLTHVGPDRIQADIHGTGIFANLEAMLATTPPDVPLDVIVRYRSGHEDAAAQIEAHISRRLERDRSVAAQLTGAEI